MSVQNDLEITQRGVDQKALAKYCKQIGIKTFLRYPVSDDNEREYCNDMFEVQKILADLINQGHKVFLHCTSGMSRGPSIAAVYICLNMIGSKWQNPQEV